MINTISGIIALGILVFLMAWISVRFEEKERARVQNNIHKKDTPFPKV